VSSPQNRRRVLVLADQAASSLSNVVVAVLVARSFPDVIEPFAAFSLAIMVFQFLVGCSSSPCWRSTPTDRAPTALRWCPATSVPR
jgi:hypothetical protein